MTDDFISDEDKALFRALMRTVTPLKEKNKRINTHKAPPEHIPVRKNTPHTPIKKEYFLSDYLNETIASHEVLSYAVPSLPRKRVRALKQGHIPWEARLDLHGFMTEAARDALCHFIQKQSDNNVRCVLIIHGKGGHLGAPPVIKNLINRWLPQFPEVLAFHSAVPKDGGHGAVYVLLKKRESDVFL